MHTLTVLVGLPASGKSHWVNRFRTPGAFVYSPDAMVEFIGKTVGKTYDEVWGDAVKAATRWMDEALDVHKAAGNDVIWDQTNMGLKKRQAILARFPRKTWLCNAVVFRMPETPEELAEHAQRLASRPGKTIPASVLQSMRDSYVRPTLEEGFDYVTETSTWRCAPPT